MSLLAKPERNERGLVGQGERMEGLPMLVAALALRGTPTAGHRVLSGAPPEAGAQLHEGGRLQPLATVLLTPRFV